MPETSVREPVSAGVSRYASSGAQHQLALLLFFFFSPLRQLSRALSRAVYIPLSAGVNLVRPQGKELDGRGAVPWYRSVCRPCELTASSVPSHYVTVVTFFDSGLGGSSRTFVWVISWVTVFIFFLTNRLKNVRRGWTSGDDSFVELNNVASFEASIRREKKKQSKTFVV